MSKKSWPILYIFITYIKWVQDFLDIQYLDEEPDHTGEVKKNCPVYT